jgi:hypothetical protein
MSVRVTGWLFRLDVESKRRCAPRYAQEGNCDDLAISGHTVHFLERTGPFYALNRRLFLTTQLKVQYQFDRAQIDL